MKKIAFIESTCQNTKNGGYSGVGYYRIVKPAQYLKNDYDITVYGKDIVDLGNTNEEMYLNLFNSHDLVITKAVDSPRSAGAMAFFSDYTKTPYVVDLDDNYFEVRKDQPGYKHYYPGSNKRAIFAAYLGASAGIICSTRPLAKSYKDYMKKVYGWDKPVFVAPNFNDLTDFDFKPAKKKKDKVIIGWQGSTTHISDLNFVLPALENILKRNQNVRFEILGALEKEQAAEVFKDWDKGVLNKVSIGAGTQSWAGYPELLSKQAWDIGIAPLIDDEFNRGKSHIKWMEYADYKIPCVASKVYPYFMPVEKTETIRHGETGFLCSTVKEWEENLQALIDNIQLRHTIGENAYNFVRDNWQADKQIRLYKKAIDSFLK
jgi:glycosyltransferase involved in cell wall biosynthesis